MLPLEKVSGGKPPFPTCNFAELDLWDLSLNANPTEQGTDPFPVKTLAIE